jgi:hypothetical protein
MKFMGKGKREVIIKTVIASEVRAWQSLQARRIMLPTYRAEIATLRSQ